MTDTKEEVKKSTSRYVKQGHVGRPRKEESNIPVPTSTEQLNTEVGPYYIGKGKVVSWKTQSKINGEIKQLSCFRRPGCVFALDEDLFQALLPLVKYRGYALTLEDVLKLKKPKTQK